MGAHKRLIRTSCLAALLIACTATTAVANELETQQGVASFTVTVFKARPLPVVNALISRR